MFARVFERSPRFTRHIHDQVIAEVGPDRLRPLDGAPKIPTNPVVARLGPDYQFLGACTKHNAIPLEAPAQMGTADHFAEHSQGAGVPAGVERDYLGVIDGETSHQLGN